MKYDLTCDACKLPFKSKWPHVKACSRECRRVRYLRNVGRSSFSKGIASGTVGTITEMIVSVDLMKKGYAVFRALSPACFCDLIIVKNNLISRVEVKTGYMNPTSKNIVFPKVSHGEIDLFGVFIPSENEIFYFKSDAKTIVQI